MNIIPIIEAMVQRNIGVTPEALRRFLLFRITFYLGDTHVQDPRAIRRRQQGHAQRQQGQAGQASADQQKAEKQPQNNREVNAGIE